MPFTEEEVRRLITMALTKSCALDPIPTFLLKEVIDVLLPYLTSMVNASLREEACCRDPAAQEGRAER